MRRLIASAAAALLITSAAHAAELPNGKKIAIGAAGIPYVVGGTAQENWLVQNQQHLADKELIANYQWPTHSVYAAPPSTTVNIIVQGW